MTKPLVPADSKPAFQRLRLSLRDAILSGELTGRLPSERELARQHGLAYMTARRAIDALVADRLAHRVPGVGTFVSRAGDVGTRADNIGIVLATGIRYGTANPFYGPIVAGALAAARAARIAVFVCSTGDELLPRREDLDSRRKVDGLLALGRPDADGAATLAACARFVPVMTFNNPAVDETMPSLRSDDEAGGRMAAAHLLERGHRDLAWIGAGHGSAVDRLAGFRAGLAEAGIDPTGLRCGEGDYEIESGERLATGLLAAPGRPRAIACANDAMACGVLRAAHRAGLSVPRDLAVLGFDDLLLDRYLPQPLSSIGIDAEAAGRTAVETLLAHCAGRPVQLRQVLPWHLAVRETT